ncbi:hypothetical protein ACFL51_00130 [Myxococcota bacterium]
MTDDVRTVRLPDSLWERIDAMAQHLEDDPELSLHGAVTRSTVMRLALSHGLKVLERKYGRPKTQE